MLVFIKKRKEKIHLIKPCGEGIQIWFSQVCWKSLSLKNIFKLTKDKPTYSWVVWVHFHLSSVQPHKTSEKTWNFWRLNWISVKLFQNSHSLIFSMETLLVLWKPKFSQHLHWISLHHWAQKPPQKILIMEKSSKAASRALFCSRIFKQQLQLITALEKNKIF